MDLSQNNIKSAAQIKEGLICNIRLEKLDLSNNMMNDEGIALLSQALASNACIETISISFNEYTVEGIKSFLEVF